MPVPGTHQGPRRAFWDRGEVRISQSFAETLAASKLAKLPHVSSPRQPTEPVSPRRRRQIGWMFVAAQAVLLILVFTVPTSLAATMFEVTSWHRRSGFLFSIAGFALVVTSAIALGRRLTAHPDPNGWGDLRVRGLYRFVRHPMYSGVMALAIGATISTGSAMRGGATLALIVLFNAKARFEEQALAQYFADYTSYAATTPRFLPFRLRGTRRM